MNELPSLILASASPRRQQLLEQMGLRFETCASHEDEVHTEYLTVSEICQINAYRKARQISKKFPDSTVIGADTLVAIGTRTFAKPRNEKDAEEMLAQLQGRTHQVVTGVCLINLRTHRQKTFSEMTHVRFRPLTRQQIREYIGKVNTLDKAGAYAIQEHGDELVASIKGSRNNVVGLPTERLLRELEQFQGDAIFA